MTASHAAPTQSRRSVSWQVIAIGAMMLLGQLPLLLKFFTDLWSRPQYQFFPIALIAAAYVFLERFREVPLDELDRGSARVTAGLLAASWFILSAGLLYLRWMAPVSAWLLLAAAVWWTGGARLARAVLPAGILLLIIIPPPAHYDEAIGGHLRVLAVYASSRVLDLLALPHLVTGTVIEVPGHRLLVEEACSGINSLLSVMAFTILYGMWQRRPAWFTAILTVFAAGFVLCANVLRITLGAMLVHFWKIDILTGTGHELLGLVLFGISLGLVISFDRFLMLTAPRRKSGPRALSSQDRQHGRGAARLSSTLRLRPEGSSPKSRPTAAGGMVWWPAAVAFLALGICMQARVGKMWAQSRLPDGAKFSMPENLAGWELVRGEGMLNGRPETDGLKSNFWVYQSGPMKAAVALDYPFSGFHDATICYASSGWTINGKEQRQPSGRRREGYFHVQMAKAPLMRGQLLFAQFDEHGMAPAVTAEVPDDVGRVKLALLLSRRKAEALPTYQMQTLSLDYSAISQEQQASLRELFIAARAELSRQVTAQLEGSR